MEAGPLSSFLSSSHPLVVMYTMYCMSSRIAECYPVSQSSRIISGGSQEKFLVALPQGGIAVFCSEAREFIAAISQCCAARSSHMPPVKRSVLLSNESLSGRHDVFYAVQTGQILGTAVIASFSVQQCMYPDPGDRTGRGLHDCLRSKSTKVASMYSTMIITYDIDSVPPCS